MPSFGLSFEIARSPNDVFAYLTDIARLPEWQSSAVSAEVEGEPREGALIRERRKFIGRDVTIDLEVTAYEPPRRFEVRSHGSPVSFKIRHMIAPAAAGTRLDVDVEVKVSTMLRIAAQGPLKLAEREFRSDFDRLKDILEQQGPLE